jgi:hypothetical protein
MQSKAPKREYPNVVGRGSLESDLQKIIPASGRPVVK